MSGLLWRAIVVSLSATIILASRVEAQTKDTAAQLWSLRLGANAVLQNNAQLSDQGGARDVGSRFDLGLSRVWILHRGTVTFVGDANQILYRNSTSLDMLSYSVGVAASYTLTRRLALTFSDNASSSRAQDSQLLTAAGLVFAQTLTRTNALGTQLSYDISPRTRLVASLGATRVSFASSELSGGSTWTPRIALTRQLTRSQSVGISYAQTISDGITGDIQGMLGTWQASLGKRFTVSASGGIRPYVLAGMSGHQYAPGGGGGLTARFGRAGKASVIYERAVEQAYGFTGTHLAHRINAAYEMAVGRRLGLDASFAYGLNTYPLDPSFRLQGRTLVVSARYRLVQNLSVTAVYGMWTKIYGESAPVSSTQNTVALAYGVSWR